MLHPDPLYLPPKGRLLSVNLAACFRDGVPHAILLLQTPYRVFSSVTQLYLTLCDPMDCHMPGFSVHHQILELTQTRVHRVSDVIQPSHPLSSPSPPIFNHSQHQGLFQSVSSSHQVTKLLEFQLQHQSFQWIFRTTAGHIHQGNQNWKRHIYPNVHCSTVYNSQDMEAT